MEILFEDNHLIVVNKNPSEIVQGDKTGDVPLSEKVKSYLKNKYSKPGEVFLGVTHRIDRPVSGIVIFAKTGKALERMNTMFREKEVKKTYWAVVKNKPQEEHGTLIHFLKKNEAKNRSTAYAKDIPGSKQAELDYILLASSDTYHLLEVYPKTGRHHQIRAQLSAMGCPIKGDVKYGFARTNKDASIHLHARKVEFIHPVQKTPVIITSNPPAENLWQEFLKILA